MALPPDFEAAWTGMSLPWRRCLELSWDAHRAGSVPVGAVIVDPDGEIVAAGRNRSTEFDPPAGQLAGSYLAHAEVNALLALPPGDYENYVLYTTLEPCLLCTAAMIHCHVGEVHFAATDHLWHGIDDLPGVNEHIARRWPRRVGPLRSPFAVWAGVLPLLWTLDRSPAGVVVGAYEKFAPDLLDLARSLHRTRTRALDQDSLPATLRLLWSQLASIGAATPV